MEQPAFRDRDSRYAIVCWRKHAVLWVADHRHKQTNKRTIEGRTFIKPLSGRQAHATGMTNGLRALIVPFRPATDAPSTAGVMKLATLAVFLHDSDLRRRDAVSFAKFRWVAVPSSADHSSPSLGLLLTKHHGLTSQKSGISNNTQAINFTPSSHASLYQFLGLSILQQKQQTTSHCLDQTKNFH